MRTRSFHLCALALGVLTPSGCSEVAAPGADDDVLAPEFASTSGAILFNTTLHPPDPCEGPLGLYIEGVAQLTLRDNGDGYDVEWRGLLTDPVGGLTFEGELFDAIGNEGVSGTDFEGLSSPGGSDLVRLAALGSPTIDSESGDDVIATPQEYEVQISVDNSVVLVGNLADHPPDPC